MSLKYVPANAPFLITLPGILFPPKTIYKAPLSSNTEVFRILTASFLLIPHKIHLEWTPFKFNIAMFFNSSAVINTSWHSLPTYCPNLNPRSLKYQ